MPNESGALLQSFKARAGVLRQCGFWQEIAVTPVQMIRALGAIANGGVMVQPHLVSAIRLDSGITRKLDGVRRFGYFLRHRHARRSR